MNFGDPQPRATAIAVRWIALAGAFGLGLIATLRVAAIPTDGAGGKRADRRRLLLRGPGPALLAGKGYSFDGEARTNGVQPLWAAVCVGLAAMLPHDDAVLHAMVLLSGLLWIGAGAVLYRAFRKYDPWLATLVATGWLLIGFRNRMALQGMENGLHAFLFASILAFGIRYLRLPGESAGRFDRPRFYLGLGLLLAIFRAGTGRQCAAGAGRWACWSSRVWFVRAASDGRDGTSRAPRGSRCPDSCSSWAL